MEFIASLLGIFQNCLLPVFLLIGLGFAVQRRFGLDVRTLTRLNLWIFVPALVLDRLSRANLSGGDLGRVVGFTLLLMAGMYAVAQIWCRARRYSVGLSAAFTCAVIFYNSGNYGLPVIELVFGKDSPAMALQTIVLAVQNVTTFSLGAIIIRGPSVGVRAAVVEYLKMPFLYAIGLGLLLQRTGWQLPMPIGKAVQIAGDGLVPIALVTLGAQLGQVSWSGRAKTMVASTAMRLAIAPAVAFCLLRALGWTGLVAQQLLISTSFPSAINAALLAIEYDNEPDFAAQAVMTATLLSALTVAITIYVARHAF
ncbi:MAG: AEC family transporter [Armatimonadetes bacterium]|nr:AEC family transporter [Armatimonadota bacterium]